MAVWVHLLGYLLRKRKQSLFLCLVVQAIVFLYFIRWIFTVSKTKIFRCFPNTLNITFTFQMFFICTLFSYNNFENSWKCYFKIPWSMLNFCIFSKIKYKPCGWAINLGDKYQSFLISIFLLSLPVMKVRPRNFGSSHQIYCRRRSWAMEVIVTVGIKF